MTWQTLYGLQRAVWLVVLTLLVLVCYCASVLALVALEVGAMATRQDWPRRRLLEREKLAPAAPGASPAS